MSQTKTQLVEGLDLASAPADSLVIDSSGRLLVGTSSTSAASRAVFQGNSSSSAAGPEIYFQRGSTPSGVNGLGYLYFADNASNIAASIVGTADGGTWTSGSSHPGRLLFSTTADGAASPTERMRIDSSGVLTVGSGANSATQRAAFLGGFTTFENSAGTGNPSITFNNDIDTGILNPAGNTLAFNTGGNERLRIDSSGRLLVGTSSGRSIDGINAAMQVEGTTTATSAINLTRNANSQSSAFLQFAKSRGTSNGSSTVVQNGDVLGYIQFAGADGTDVETIAANIRADVDGTPGANDMPGRLVFSTTADGASSPTERLRIDREGNSIFGSAGTLNSQNTVGIIPSEGRITFGMDGRNTLVTGENSCYIFSGGPAGGSLNAGDLIIQSRSNLDRNILFATGSTPTVRMTIAGNGNVSVAGALSKGSGSFKIDHPLPEKKETYHLVHSFIEGPQADLIYRGKVELSNGAATVNLDTAARMTEGTFVLLNTNVQCFTSNESDWTAVRGSVSGNILTIAAEDNTSTATVSWLVIGERQDQHMLDTNWTDENGRVITEPLKETELVSEDPEAN